MRIEPVTSKNIEKAAYVHSVSWKESHKSFCSESFVAEHTAERQKKYIEQKMNNGAELFVLFDKEAKGVVSVSGCMIEDLYVLPTEQRKGYGTILLRYAEQKCTGDPVLWVLSNNMAAKSLYLKNDYHFTGKTKGLQRQLQELEMKKLPNKE